MNILILSHNLNFEGAPKSIMELARGLASRFNYDVKVWSPVSGPLSNIYRHENLSILFGLDGKDVVDLNASWFGRNYTDYCLNVQRIIDAIFTKYFSNFGYPDVVIANTILNFWAVYYFRSKGIPVVWIIRESEGVSMFDCAHDIVRSALRDAFNSCDRIVFVANETLDVYHREVDIEKCSVITNGLDGAEIFHPLSRVEKANLRNKLGFSEEDFIIFNCGTFSDRKNQKEIVDAFILLCSCFKTVHNLKLVLVGSNGGEYSRELIRYVSKNFPEDKSESENSIVCLDATKTVHEYYQISDLFGFSSRLESYPRVVLEAMAAGLPVVSTPTMGVKSQVINGENAEFYESGNCHDLALKLASYIFDRDKLNEHGKRSFLLSSTNFSFEKMLRQYLDVLKSLSFSYREKQ